MDFENLAVDCILWEFAATGVDRRFLYSALIYLLLILNVTYTFG
jgi:hypothetical protein